MCVCVYVCVCCALTREIQRKYASVLICVYSMYMLVWMMCIPHFWQKGDIFCSVCVLVCVRVCACVCVQQSRSISVVCRETAVPSATARYGGVSPAVTACYI